MAPEEVDLDRARAAKQALRTRLADDDRIVGVGIARAEAGYLIKVNLSVAEAADAVPSTVDDVAVVTEVVGTIRPL